ncbi:MAG: MGH1-like glycoside hydrolase domain-containing protein, partial [Victivallaceae bacterium]
EIAERQYSYLKDCIASGEIRKQFNGMELTGLMSAADLAIYPPIWVVDHYFNTLAMLDYDADLAKKMFVGGIIANMDLDEGPYQGRLQLKTGAQSLDHSTTYPVWMTAAAEIFQKTKDKKFLETVFPLLELHSNYIDRHFLKDGVYVGAGGFWNDYSTGPKKMKTVAGIGINSLSVLEKNILSSFAAQLGFDAKAQQYAGESRTIAKHLNSRFWDEKAGLYFDYDIEQKVIFTTRSGRHFFGLDNLLPLYAGFVPQERLERIEYHLTSSHSYGKYAAITTDLSPDFMDERRLMVWAMTNWMVIKGLRNYKLDSTADSIAAHIFNGILKNWAIFRSLPEALSATHGFTPMENENLAGVGVWTAFYLYLKEVCLKG